LAAAFWVRTTKSFFSDTEKITGNVLSVATSWVSGTPTPELTPAPTPTTEPTSAPSVPAPELTPTATPTSTPLANHLVINEVYYDVGARVFNDIVEKEGDNEWIEIYNGSSQSFDLQNWQLCDNQDCRSIATSSLILNSGNFVVITNDASSWNYWEISNGVIKIVLSSRLSLANDNDMLLLKDKDGNIIDQMNWGTPSSDWPNYNVNLWDPVPSVTAGHSLERSPVGRDTNIAADFVERSSPTPGS